MKKIMGLVIGLMPVSAFAECVPVPDCASIGYTETNCDGDSLKCPFDTTKLKCIPCDSSFRFACDGENVKNPIGAACNNKYVACECGDRTTFVNGECVCDTSCDTIGNIVYSDQTCSSCKHSDKTPVAVVVHKDINNRFIAPLNVPDMRWTSSNTDLTTLENLETEEIAKMDMAGPNNTQKIREYYSGDDETNNAAWYCYNLELDGFEEYKHQWYLPAAGELYNYYYINITSINKAFSTLGLGNYNKLFWSSSEASYHKAWLIKSYNGTISSYYNKADTRTVSCLLAWK